MLDISHGTTSLDHVLHLSLADGPLDHHSRDSFLRKASTAEIVSVVLMSPRLCINREGCSEAVCNFILSVSCCKHLGKHF